MKSAKRVIYTLVTLLIVIGIGLFVINNYSYVFSRHVRGEVIGIDRVTQPLAILGNHATDEQMYSFSVAIRTKNGKIYTSSSEDRQWAVVQKGNCVDATFFPYPPWNFDKARTYHNARVDELFTDCSKVELSD